MLKQETDSDHHNSTTDENHGIEIILWLLENLCIICSYMQNLGIWLINIKIMMSPR